MSRETHNTGFYPLKIHNFVYDRFKVINKFTKMLTEIYKATPKLCGIYSDILRYVFIRAIDDNVCDDDGDDGDDDDKYGKNCKDRKEREDCMGDKDGLGGKDIGDVKEKRKKGSKNGESEKNKKGKNKSKNKDAEADKDKDRDKDKDTIKDKDKDTKKYIHTNQIPNTIYMHFGNGDSLIDDEYVSHEVLHSLLKNKKVLDYEITEINKMDVFCDHSENDNTMYKYTLTSATTKLNIYVFDTEYLSKSIHSYLEVLPDNLYQIGHKDNDLDTMLSSLNKKNITGVYNLICRKYNVFQDMIKLYGKDNIRYTKFADIVMENESECPITMIEPPYLSIVLKCGHKISCMALFGSIMAKKKQVSKCSLCMGKFAISYLNSNAEDDEHSQMIDDYKLNKNVSEYIISLCQSKDNSKVQGSPHESDSEGTAELEESDGD